MLMPDETKFYQLTLAVVVSGLAGRDDVAVGIEWNRDSQVARAAYAYELTPTRCQFVLRCS